VSLLARVAAHLRQQGSEFAVIGAAALAVHGIARSTQDLDLLVLDRRCLGPVYWDPVRTAGVEVTVRPGDEADPLAGVVRLRAAGQTVLDVVVGKARWQSAVIAHALPAHVDGVEVPAARAAGLILLKLYAGGPQDAWDIVQLLAVGDSVTLVADVEGTLGELPPDSRRLWTRIREG
jgi:hypothetical protein